MTSESEVSATGVILYLMALMLVCGLGCSVVKCLVDLCRLYCEPPLNYAAQPAHQGNDVGAAQHAPPVAVNMNDIFPHVPVQPQPPANDGDAETVFSEGSTRSLPRSSCSFDQAKLFLIFRLAH